MKKTIAIIAACMSLFAVGCKDQPSNTTDIPAASSGATLEFVGGSGSTGAPKANTEASSTGDASSGGDTDTGTGTVAPVTHVPAVAPASVPVVPVPSVKAVEPVTPVAPKIVEPVPVARPIVGMVPCPTWQCGFGEGKLV